MRPLGWLCPALLLLLARSSKSFTLEGSPTSYIRFPKWYQAFENTVTLEFRTKKRDGLLFYTDDGGRGNFVEVGLVAGRLQLRLKIGLKGHRPEAEIPTAVVEAGSGLGDGRWHRLRIDQYWQNVKLQLDDQPVFRKLAQTNLVFGKYQDFSDVFVGGIPKAVSETKLSSPMAKYKPHFAGSVRNIVYRTLPHGMTAPHPLDSEGTRETEDDYCLSSPDQCRNGGLCYSTNDGPRCDCTRTPDFQGDYCQNDQCRNGGLCYSTNDGPRCDCTRTPDFQGDYCQNDQCRNGGLCYSTNDGLRCDCTRTPDFQGDYCQNDQCRNGGLCYSTNDGPRCDCTRTPDFQGDYCQNDQCRKGGLCYSTNDGPRCDCTRTPDFQGDYCQNDQCRNGGLCYSTNDGPRCDCTRTPDFQGDYCQNDQCRNGGLCYSTNDGPRCDCTRTPDFQGDYCQNDQCRNGGLCYSTNDGPRCDCTRTPDFQGDYCQNDQCRNGGLCYSTNDGPRCDCTRTPDFQGDYCQNDQCRNGGLCYSTNDGPRCDCTRTPDFQGDYCQNEVPAPVASMSGGEYFAYDFSETRNGVNSREEELSLTFKTSRPDAILFYAGDIQDYIHVALKGGAAVATSNLGSGPRNITIDPFVRDGGLKFDDDQWHHLVLHRRLTTMSLRVDGQHAAVEQTEGHMEWLSHVVAYVGSKPPAKILPKRLLTTPFKGCLTKIRYRADNRYLDFLEMARKSLGRQKAGMVRTFGNISWSCRDASAPRPISVLNSDAFLTLPSWVAPSQGVLSFKFRSNEPDGLILFNAGLGRNSSSDYVAFELVDGQLFFAMNLGSGHLRLQASSAPLSDKTEWHSVILIRDGQKGSVLVDDLKTEFATPGKASLLDLGGEMYLGGLDWPGQQASHVPTSVYSASLRRGFVGCLRDLTLNGVTSDLVQYLHQGSARSDIQAGCAITVDMCPAAPCLNGGRCREGWRRFLCDCDGTAKEGPVCSRDPMRVAFERRNQLLRVALPNLLVSEAEDLELKFQTEQRDGYLVGTSSDRHPDRLHLLVYDAQLYLELQFGTYRLKPVSLSTEVSDGRWHSVRLRRRGGRLRLSLDGADPDLFEIAGAPTLALRYDTFWAGHSEAPDLRIDDQATVPSLIPKVGFVGQLAGLRFNGLEVFSLAADLELGGSLPLLAVTNSSSRLRIPEWTKPAERVVSFESRTAWLELPESLIAQTGLLHLFFQFRTLESTGLLLYAAGISRDFFAVELDKGRLRYVFNSGDGPKLLLSSLSGLDDFQWHRVQIYQATPEEHFLVVDNSTTKISLQGANTELNLRGVLHVGGLGLRGYGALPPAVLSRHGYRGCLASFAIAHAAVDLVRDHVRMESVGRGCQGPEVLCSPASCESGGVCRQQWTSTSCDCSMTTRSGARCEESATSFAFGPGPGALLWEWPEGQRPSTGEDVLALGLRTESEDDAVLFRVDSNSPKDFLQLEITGGGFASVSYNLGGQSYRVGDLMRRVNDGRYHVVRFRRSAANATFQLDDFSQQFKSPPGDQLQTLNQQAFISVGGRVELDKRRLRRAPAPRVRRSFRGTLSGLNFNGLYVLDKAAEGDPRVRHIGAVSQPRSRGAAVYNGPDRVRPLDLDDDFASELTSRMMSSSSSVGPTDDVIVTTGSGSGCQSDEQMSDDDECVLDEDPDSPELITPDYERMFTASTTTTRRTTSTPRPTLPTRPRTTPTTTTTTTTTPSTTRMTLPTRATTRKTTTTAAPAPKQEIYFTSEERADMDDIDDPDPIDSEGSGDLVLATTTPRWEQLPTRPTSTEGSWDRAPPEPPIDAPYEPPYQPEDGGGPQLEHDYSVGHDTLDGDAEAETAGKAPERLTKDGIGMETPPRPTASGGEDLAAPNFGNKPTPPGDQAMDQTGTIILVAVGLLALVLLLLCLGWHCRRRRKPQGVLSSYAVEERERKPLYSSEIAPGTAPPIIQTRVAQVNGYSPIKPVLTNVPKKSKDFKEWYV